jgi:hypothetical protein
MAEDKDKLDPLNPVDIKILGEEAELDALVAFAKNSTKKLIVIGGLAKVGDERTFEEALKLATKENGSAISLSAESIGYCLGYIEFLRDKNGVVDYTKFVESLSTKTVRVGPAG